MKKILFNDPAINEDRYKVKGLSLKEENEVIEILNESLNFFDESQIKKVQKLIYHYENVCHFATINSVRWLEYSDAINNQKNDTIRSIIIENISVLTKLLTMYPKKQSEHLTK